MRRTRSLFVVGVAVVMLLTVQLRAHHAFAAEYTADRPLLLDGTVTQMDWVNPHAWIHMDVKNHDGKVENWMIEVGAPNALLRRGWTKNDLLPGTRIIVKGYGAKDGENRANGRDITLSDGRKLFAGSSGTGAPDERPEDKK